MRFDGSAAWQRYKTTDGLLSDEVTTIASASDGSIWAMHALQGYSRLEPDTGKWQPLPELAGATSLQHAPDGSLWFLYQDALLQLQPEAPLASKKTFKPPDVNGATIRLEALTLTNDSVWSFGREMTLGEPVLARYEPRFERWTLHTWESTGGAMPLSSVIGLSRLSDDTLFIHTFPAGGYRLIPGPGGDSSFWNMITYPRWMWENPINVTSAKERDLLEQLIPVRWLNGGTYYTLIK